MFNFPPRNVEQVSKELCSLVLWAPPKLQCVFVFPENYNKMMMFSMLLREIRKVLLSWAVAARVARVAQAPSSKCQVFRGGWCRCRCPDAVIKAAHWKLLQQYKNTNKKKTVYELTICTKSKSRQSADNDFRSQSLPSLPPCALLLPLLNDFISKNVLFGT